MSMNELEQLLERIREGAADDRDFDRARELLGRDEAAFPLPLGLAIDYEGGAVDVDRGVSRAIGVEHPAILEAVHAEAGDIDVTADVMNAIGAKLPLAEAVRDELGEAIPLTEAVAFEAGTIDLVDMVLARLELADGRVPVADAVRAEAGDIDVASAVLAAIGAPSELADALTAEAGTIDVADGVMAAIFGKAAPAPAPVVEDEQYLSALLDHELTEETHRRFAESTMRRPGAGVELTALAEVGRELRLAVEHEAGECASLWDGVARAIGIAEPEAVAGWDGKLLAEAVRYEAGAVDVTREVMLRVRRSAVVAGAELPAPANRGFAWGAVALAAVLMMFFAVIGRNYYSGSDEVVAERQHAALDFAAADEIRFDLASAENTWVELPAAEGDPVIIWVEEEAAL